MENSQRTLNTHEWRDYLMRFQAGFSNITPLGHMGVALQPGLIHQCARVGQGVLDWIVCRSKSASQCWLNGTSAIFISSNSCPPCSLGATDWQNLCSQENISDVWTALDWLGVSVPVAHSLSISVFMKKCLKGDVGILISREYWIKNNILCYGALLSSSCW